MDRKDIKRNVFAHVPQWEREVVAAELQEVFVAKRRSTAEALGQRFAERYGDRLRRAVEVFAQGLEEALTDLDVPSSHHSHIKSTNVRERLFREINRRKNPQKSRLDLRMKRCKQNGII
ncbi:MAG: transposase [Thermoanaerobaculum sp.]